MVNFMTAEGTVASQFVKQSHLLGHLLYWHKHGNISIQIRQDKTLRWLLINDTLQSVVERNHPENLLFPHLQQLARLWNNSKSTPNNVLELGLGAGAIRDYLITTYPNCDVFSVDNNPEIIRCYKRYFSGDHTCAVACMNVGDVLTNEEMYDWIILDLFSEIDAPLFLFQHQFYRQLRARLRPGGTLYINFLAEHDSQLKKLTHLLITNFGKKPYIEHVPNYANHIIMVGR